MADGAEDDIEIDGAGEGGADGEKGAKAKGRMRRLSGRSLVLFVILPVLLLAGGGGGAYFAGVFDPAEGDEPAKVAQAPKSFFDMPEIIVNLSGRDGQRTQYLKLKVSLELMDKDVEAVVEPLLPRIVDMFQIYLRELRPADLEGSAGMFRLKEELIRRVNLEISPQEISDVLFKQIIIQ